MRLVLTHRKLPDHDQVLGVSGGWHTHLGVLVSKLTGTPQAPFWATLAKLKNDYTAAFDLNGMDPGQGFCAALHLDAPADQVYAALTTPEGLKGWWTETCDVGTSVGGQSTFRFDETYKTMRIEKLLPAAEVRWRCVDSSLELPQGRQSHEWIDTEFHFALTPLSEHSTALRFQHLGLLPPLECYNDCLHGWTRFLGSLKQIRRDRRRRALPIRQQRLIRSAPVSEARPHHAWHREGCPAPSRQPEPIRPLCDREAAAGQFPNDGQRDPVFFRGANRAPY